MGLTRVRYLLTFAIALALGTLSTSMPNAWGDDWPEWRGAGRTGVWNEEGILEKFPEGGLDIVWRTPIYGGYTGPSVSEGRVYLSDFRRTQGNDGLERALCLDEETGAILWVHEWPESYKGLMYNVGPRATPTVDGDRVYVLGTMGALYCLSTETGDVVWSKNYVSEYNTDVPIWGITGAPIVEGDLLIGLVGGEDGAKVVAFEKNTGVEIWRALSSDWEPGYSQPIIVDRAGVRQLIIWQPRAVSSLNPRTGEIYWEQPFDAKQGLTVATPVVEGDRLLVSSFYTGSMMLKLDIESPGATRVWQGTSTSEVKTDGLHALITTPVIQGDYIYGICSYGQFRCLDANTGERIWETQDVTREKARWAAGLIVRQGDRYFINNDRGELIIARFTPEGYEEIDRTQLIEPTTRGGGRRELPGVNWSHPAYANGHIIARNDIEIIRASLKAP